MAKLDKILNSWKRKPKEVRRDEVVNVLEKLGFELEFKRGSHIVVRHEKLREQPHFGLNDEFTIPTVKGRYIKGFYLERILLAIETITED